MFCFHYIGPDTGTGSPNLPNNKKWPLISAQIFHQMHNMNSEALALFHDRILFIHAV
jgi:hypothetical protein